MNVYLLIETTKGMVDGIYFDEEDAKTVAEDMNANEAGEQWYTAKVMIGKDDQPFTLRRGTFFGDRFHTKVRPMTFGVKDNA